MSIEDLFAGVGVVIDDKVFSSNEQDDRIVTIVRELESVKKFPLVKYATLPDDAVLRKLTNVSFLLLDWEIDSREDILGESGLDVPVGAHFKAEQESRVIDIVKSVLKTGLMPVFIFSNQDISSINKKLSRAGVDLEKSQVFIKSKSELVEEGVLFRKIGEWVDGVSAVYVAKAWEHAFCKAKSQFFAEMANNTSHWPRAIYNAAMIDSTDPAEEITRVISQNIISRMQPIELLEEQINKDTTVPSKEEVLGIMKGQFFLDKPVDASMVGDFYSIKESGHGEKFYINVRPTCDCVERTGNDGLIYLLQCTQITANKAAKLYDNGHFNETVACAIVGPLHHGKFFQIRFKAIETVKYDEWKERKVGRVLPPIINHITERYSLYVQRQALPRIPDELVLDIVKSGFPDAPITKCTKELETDSSCGEIE